MIWKFVQIYLFRYFCFVPRATIQILPVQMLADSQSTESAWPLPLSHSFVTTGVDGKNMYGHACRYWVRADPNFDPPHSNQASEEIASTNEDVPLHAEAFGSHSATTAAKNLFRAGDLVSNGWIPQDFDWARNIVIVPICLCVLTIPQTSKSVIPVQSARNLIHRIVCEELRKVGQFDLMDHAMHVISPASKVPKIDLHYVYTVVVRVKANRNPDPDLSIGFLQSISRSNAVCPYWIAQTECYFNLRLGSNSSCPKRPCITYLSLPSFEVHFEKRQHFVILCFQTVDENTIQ